MAPIIHSPDNLPEEIVQQAVEMVEAEKGRTVCAFLRCAIGVQ